MVSEVINARKQEVPLQDDNSNKKDTLRKLNPNKCIGCGLCSYICPSKIDLREDVKESKKVIGD